MKRIIASLLLAVMLIASAASAESLSGSSYVDVPAALTQDTVLNLTAGDTGEVTTLPQNPESISLLNAVYSFVRDDGNRPARYYDEETQKEITVLADHINIDALHMTEAMGLQLSGTALEPVIITMSLDANYSVDQLIIVVLGIPGEDGTYQWYSYRGQVAAPGQISWIIPAEDWIVLCRQPISFHVLTDRIGSGSSAAHRETETEHYDIFSKESGDVTKTRRWYTSSGEPVDDDFIVELTDLTDSMKNEVSRVGEHLAEGGSLMDCFPQERREEALLMLPEGTDSSELIAYDVIALRSKNYRDTYGDVNVDISFGTSYAKDKGMVVLAVFPSAGTDDSSAWDWYVLRAQALEDEDSEDDDHTVEISLRQLNLPRMDQEPMMLFVISEPVEASPANPE